MTDLLHTAKQNISLHIQNMIEEGELNPEATVNEYGRFVRRRREYKEAPGQEEAAIRQLAGMRPKECLKEGNTDER